MTTGFYVADLARRNNSALTASHLDGIHRADAMPMDARSWGFPESVPGRSVAPEGTTQQYGSASAALVGHLAINGKKVFTNNAPHPTVL